MLTIIYILASCYIFDHLKCKILDITPYIRELILLNESVILRGFGGFDTSYKNAVIDKDRNKFIPPGKNIKFRHDWVIDNGVLEGHISESLQISKTEASEYIDKFVKDLIRKLNEKGSVKLEGIGTFTGSNGKITFKPIEDETYLADSFGLDPLEVKPMAGKKTKTKKAKPSTHYKKKNWVVIIILLLVLGSATTYIFLSDNKIKDLFKPHEEAVAPAEKKTDIVVFGGKKDVLEDSVTQAIEQALDRSTDHQKALTPDKPEPEIVPVVTDTEITEPAQTFTSGNFYLVAGSFKSKKNAETMKLQLDQKGLRAEIIENHFYYVVIGQFGNKENATQEKARIREQYNQTIWIMEKKY